MQDVLWNHWYVTEKAIQLAMAVRGVTQRILSELSPTRLSCYSDVTISLSLNKRFCPSEREPAYRCEFRVRKCMREETVFEYGYSLNRLANRTFPNIPIANSENWVIDQYKMGLEI